MKRIVAEGHEVGNHSWSHPQLSRMTDEAVRQEIAEDAGRDRGRQRRHAEADAPALRRLHRAPAPVGNGEFGFKVILWDVDPLDWKVRNAAHVQSEILRQTVAGSIILSHDIHKTTVDAMPATLDALAAKGFKFVTVSQLIAMDHPAKPKPPSRPRARPSRRPTRPSRRVSRRASPSRAEAAPAAGAGPAAASAPAGVPPVRE